MVIIALTGLLTPIHDVPYTYILNSMLGPSNIENHASIDFIAEMQPIIPATSMKFIIFSALLIGFLLFYLQN